MGAAPSLQPPSRRRQHLAIPMSAVLTREQVVEVAAAARAAA